jgi:DNA-binding LytR/AlgR family response regulator
MKVEVREGFPDVTVIINCPRESEEIRGIVTVLQSCDTRLSGTKGGHTYLIDRKDVLYFESVDKRCFLYTTDEVYETRLKLYEVEARLSELGFFRSAKSQIINIAKIASLCPDFDGRMEVRMENDERLIVSRQYARSLKERLGLR